MAREDALTALASNANREINFAIGDLLRNRAAREDWRDSVILQQLESGLNLGGWNGLFRRTREALEEPETLPQKAAIVLNPNNPSFDDALDDFVAELLGVLYLATLDHTNIRFVIGDQRAPDLTSASEGVSCATEVKNLREPRSLSYIAFARWHRNKAARPDVFNFSVSFLEIDDPFEDLTAQQTTGVHELVDQLPERQRPSMFVVTLPGNRRVRVRIAEGDAHMVRHGPGPFLVEPIVEKCKQAVVLKLLEHSRKALTQLYSSDIPEDTRKLLFVRWKPPEEIAAIGEATTVREAVAQHFEVFFREFFPNLAVTIMHTLEDPADVPRPDWV
jgi:hypothetical protein